MAAEALITQRRTRWTRERFDRVVALGGFEGERLELVEGELVDLAPQGIPHANLIELLNELLLPRLVGRARVRIQLPLVAGEASELLPDLAILPRQASRRAHPATALLVIEVAESSVRFDRLVKAPLYAAAGIDTYWLVDVSRSQVEVFSGPGPRGYARHATVRRGALPVPGFPDVTVALAELFPRR